MSSVRRVVVVVNDLTDWEFTVTYKNSLAVAKKNAVDVQTLKKSLADTVGKETVNVIQPVQDRIQNLILT